jgi:sulfur-carrier protein
MQIQVKLFATLGRFAPHQQGAKPFSLNIEEGSTLQTITEKLDIPEDEVKISFVNGRAQKMNYDLKPGDEVGFFPPIGGG